jgi:hypothetical protein
LIAQYNQVTMHALIPVLQHARLTKLKAEKEPRIVKAKHANRSASHHGSCLFLWDYIKHEAEGCAHASINAESFSI